MKFVTLITASVLAASGLAMPVSKSPRDAAAEPEALSVDEISGGLYNGWENQDQQYVPCGD